MARSAPISRHWHRHTDADGLCWLSFDKQDSSVNALSQDSVRELASELSFLSADPPAGLVIGSAKASGFIAGADISEFQQLKNPAQAAALASRGQDLCQQVADLPCPTVAALNGFALGGGLELALACDYRVAVKSFERCLGLPEVQLGIHPGFGGTVRAVRLLGAPMALDLMLSGRSVSPVEAETMGLVDRVVDADSLHEAAAAILKEQPRLHRPRSYLRLLNLALVRPWVARSIRSRVRRRADPKHYPAPYAMIDLWQRYGARGPGAYVAEANSIGELLVGSTAKNLVRVYFLRERLRNLAPKRDDVERVHVIGAGVMGGDIASWCVVRGLAVTLQDRAMEYVEPALERAKKFFKRRLRAPGDAAAAEERLTVDLDATQIGETDVVIEAIVEQLEPKQSLFRKMESEVSEHAILATNTSSIRIEEIAAAMVDPGRLVGLHFFNPVSHLPLVEVIRGAETNEAVLHRAMSFVTQIGKLPLPCRSEPGFVVNRILAPYMLEALRAHEEGFSLETIDKAAQNFGMPTGPVELADRVGLDITLQVTEILGTSAPELLRAKVKAGELGAKTGRGFYKFKNNRPQKASRYDRPSQDLQDRLILALVNEAMACFEDGVVDDLDLLDAGVIFGTGFAPFTGGPIHYVLERGIEDVIVRLESLAERFGARFNPRPGWRKLAAG
ncbi:MAG: 3-hydroxyacyl-CoA dehydrogenase NAD-binding domain-containing protein [Gammaproteobacteria bacterium]|nr:3-hydroxyacyl-CoA dehydrogenase NAD-binding domain-containing protein [Gammaproteobacteria bacterium]